MAQSPAHDKMLLAATLALLLLGLAMVYSASAVIALSRHGDSLYYLKKQALWMGIGLVGMVAAMRLDYRAWRKLTLPFLGVSLLLLVLVLLPQVGSEVHGARRWLRVGGLSLQPAELAKLALVIYTAYVLAKKGDRIQDFLYGFFPHGVILGVFLILMVMQPDLGTAVHAGLVVVAMLFLGGARLHHLASLGLLALPALYTLVLNVAYRKRRLLAFLDPWQDPTAAGFQMVQSFLALGAGGVLGVGLGEGKQKLFFLPEPHTDFIFALIGEELGLVGAMGTLLLFGVILWRGLRVGLRAEDPFARYLALGITILVSLQAAINMGVVTGLMPTKGLPLPFVSFGGSSLVVSLVGMGILLNVSKHAG